MLTPNEVFLNQDGIIEIRVVGNQTGTSVRAMGDAITTLVEQQRAAGKPVLILDDLRQIGKVTPDGRKLVAKLAKTLDYDKVVMVGNGGLLRLGANLILRATGKLDKVAYFDDYTTAVAWLLQ